MISLVHKCTSVFICFITHNRNIAQSPPLEIQCNHVLGGALPLGDNEVRLVDGGRGQRLPAALLPLGGRSQDRRLLSSLRTLSERSSGKAVRDHPQSGGNHARDWKHHSGFYSHQIHCSAFLLENFSKLFLFWGANILPAKWNTMGSTVPAHNSGLR